MTLFNKLLIAAIYVLGFDTPTDITFEHGGHHYTVFNYVERVSCGLAIGVEFIIDGEASTLWWEIRRNRAVDNNRLHKAVEAATKLGLG